MVIITQGKIVIVRILYLIIITQKAVEISVAYETSENTLHNTTTTTNYRTWLVKIHNCTSPSIFPQDWYSNIFSWKNSTLDKASRRPLDNIFLTCILMRHCCPFHYISDGCTCKHNRIQHAKVNTHFLKQRTM